MTACSTQLAGCLRRIAQGDQSAMSTFYDETRTIVFSFACKVLRDWSDAEETTLDVYLQVWRTADTYDAQRGTVPAWLLMMTRSRALDRLRGRGAAATAAPMDVNEGLVGTEPDPEEVNLAAADRARVRLALRTLSTEQRHAIHLAFFCGFSHRELADHLGEPLGTVKSRIRAAMHKLREALSPSATEIAVHNSRSRTTWLANKAVTSCRRPEILEPVRSY